MAKEPDKNKKSDKSGDNKTVTKPDEKDTNQASVEVLSGKLREANAKLKRLEEKEQADKEKQLEEQNKFKELAEQRKTEIEKLQSQFKQQTITTKVREAALKAGANDADDFVRLVDISKVEVSEDGTIDDKQVSDLVKTTKENKPYLFNDGQGGGGKTTIGSSDSGNDAGASATPTFKRSQLKDSKFYAEHEDDILKASAEGKIIDDLTSQNQTGQPAK